MRRCVGVLFVAACAACSEPTASAKSNGGIGSGVTAPSSAAHTASAPGELVVVAIHNDAPGWWVTAIDSLPKHVTPYWYIMFGVPGRHGTVLIEEHASLPPLTMTTSTFTTGAGQLRGKRAWLHAAAVSAGPAVPGETVLRAQAIKCGPKAPSKTATPHQFTVDFHLALEHHGTLTFLRCQ